MARKQPETTNERDRMLSRAEFVARVIDSLRYLEDDGFRYTSEQWWSNLEHIVFTEN